MMKRKISLLLLLAICATRPYAQVNLQTGSAVFSLPMFNWQDDKSRLNAVVALSYNSGNGLKVNDLASNVGQGWNLVAGGVITRMQVGGPDDQVKRDGGESDISKYPAGMLYATVPTENGCPVALTKYPIYKSKNQIYTQHNLIAEDKQLDYFSFQFNGKAGMFVLNPDSLGVAMSLGDTKMKITYQVNTLPGIRTAISSFQIWDTDGLIYKFSVLGKTKVLESSYCDKNLLQSQTQPKLEGGKVYNMTGFENSAFENAFVIGSWYLSEIEDALTHRKVFFNYTTLNINNVAGFDISHNKDGNYSTVSHKKSITETPELQSIFFPDGHNVTFIYGAYRIDFKDQKVLSSVDISYSGRVISSYQLKTSYFILNRYGTPVTDYQKSVARLCLRAVQKIGVDLKEDTPPYIFDYYMGSSASDDFVPPPFFYAKDIWGFYNGTNSANYYGTPINLSKKISELNNDELKGLCFLRNSGGTAVVNYFNTKSGYAKNGLLKQIVYPTGGTLSYQYEQNTGPINGTTYTVGGVHVSQTSSTDGGSSNGCNNPITTQYNYVLNTAGNPSSLWGLEMPVNLMTTQSHYGAEYKYYRWGLSNCGIFGCCDWKFKYPGILSQYETISLTDFQKFMNAAAPVLGILSIISTIVDVATLIGTSCPGWGTIVAVIIDIICAVLAIVFSCTADMTRDATANIYFNTDLNGAAPLPAQYKRVEVTESPGTIGKTVHEFTSDDDYPVWHPTNPTFSAKQRYATWAYGLPKVTAVFNSSGNKIKETINVYNFNTAYFAHCAPQPHINRFLLLKQEINISSIKCLVKKSSSQRNTHWSDPNIYNDPTSYKTTSIADMSVDLYKMYTGRTELDTIYERVFNPNGQGYLETVTAYVYNDENYEVSLVNTKKSDGSYVQKNIYYTIDYVKVHGHCYQLTQNGVVNSQINTLVQNNIISESVESNTILYGWNTDNFKYTSDKATVFTTLANGNIKPSAILEAKFDKPTFRASFWPDDYANFAVLFPGPLYHPDNPDYSFYKTVQTFSYDASGNLTGVKDEGNRQVTNIYDYSDKYVVASVINADPVVDKSAYSSFETASLGGWSISGGSANYVSNSGITGSRALSLTSRTLSRTLNTAKAHRLSFWASSTGVSVSIPATLVTSGPTISGYTYYEYSLPVGRTSIAITGTANIDELRVYPQTARMSTMTYDPLIGKTSECDVNNRITYYEYDNLGRLRFIKDENKNVVKMYEYNNVSAAKQNGCPATYSNKLISETFTKNNCGAGYRGGNVTYTVAANTYSSTISQEDADAQAQLQILTNGQNYANTNGTCIQLYYNAAQSQVFVTETCGDGFDPGNVTYFVPANKYVSTISQADANQMALDEIAANGQAYANNPANANCTYVTTPKWEAESTAESHCLMTNGQLHKFILARDVNPHSASYNQTELKDTGEPCTNEEVLFTWSNYSGANDYFVDFWKTDGGYFYGAYEVSGGGSFNLGYIPVGTYTIRIYQWPNYYYGAYYAAGCAPHQFNMDGEAFFYNVTINSSCNTVYAY